MLLMQRISMALAMLLLLLMFTGCAPKEQREIKEYFDAVVKIEKDIDRIFTNREEMEKEIQSKKPDFTRLQGALKDQLSVLDDKIEEIKGLPVPESARSFHNHEIDGLEILRKYTVTSAERFAALEKYYILLQKDVKKMHPKEVVAIVNQGKSLAKKELEYVKKLNALSDEAAANKKKVQEEQQRLAKKYNITLK